MPSIRISTDPVPVAVLSMLAFTLWLQAIEQLGRDTCKHRNFASPAKSLGCKKHNEVVPSFFFAFLV